MKVSFSNCLINVIIFFCVVVISFSCKKRSNFNLQIDKSQIVGYWYMGTMSGYDCNLKIDSDTTLTVQLGGCFQTDPEILSNWTIKEDSILLSSRTLDDILGSFLIIGNYKNNIVLVPEKNQTMINRYGYNHEYCFWKNQLAEGGLQLPIEAEDFRK